uniref:Uncharacterized protein n=1 Tax=Romanomermis culicivorax TaxID=13658 RepID=A0A915IRF6_ROMCU
MRILKVESSNIDLECSKSENNELRKWISSIKIQSSSGSSNSGSCTKNKWSTRKRSMELMQPITPSSSPQIPNSRTRSTNSFGNLTKLSRNSTSPNRTAKYFSYIFRCLCFLLTVTSLCLILSALFTQHWVEERAQVWEMVILEANHGLYKICVKIRYNRKLSFFTKPKSLDPGNSKMGVIDACINRFEGNKKIQIFPVVDQIFDFFRRSLIAWEIMVLIMVCVSSILTLSCVIFYWFLCKNYGLILATGQLIAGVMSLSVLVTYSIYHGTKSMGRVNGPLLSFFVQQSYDFGFSYNVAIGACCCQFFTFFTILCVTMFSVCRRKFLYRQNATI